MFELIADNITTIASIVGGLAVISGGIWSLFNFFIPGFKAMRNHFEIVEKMSHEFRPNGGSSLKDSLNRLETSSETQQKKLSGIVEEIQAMSARQWALVATQKDPVWEADANGRWLRLNVELANLAERGSEEFLNNGWENAIHKEDYNRVVNEWEDAIEKKRTFDSEYRVVAKSSKIVYKVHAIATPYHMINGTLIGFIGRFVSVKSSLDNSRSS